MRATPLTSFFSRVSATAVASLLALVAVAAMVDPAPPSVAASTSDTLVVAPWGSDRAAGTEADPLRTVGEAVRRAPWGSRIELLSGRYHERIDVDGKRLTIESAPGHHAVFDGSIEVTGWQRFGRGWRLDGWGSALQIELGGIIDPRRPEAGHPDQVFIDGVSQQQVLSFEQLAPGRFFHDREADRLWIGSDPAGRTVRASTLPYAFYFRGAHGSRLANVTVKRYAGTANSMAAVRGYADRLVFEGLNVEHNARKGVSFIGRNVVIRDSRLVDNGHLGLHAHESSGFVAERLAVFGNNKAGFDPFHSAGGIKITGSSGVTVRNSDVSRNDGVGIWTDLDVVGATIIGNLVEGNGRSGIEIELSSMVNVVDNVSIGNGEYGVWVLESNNVQVFHNALFSNRTEVAVLDGPRADVTDVRVRNNIIGNSRSGNTALMSVEDWTSERSAGEMRVSIDNNAYWLPPDAAERVLLIWDEFPGRSREAPTLKAARRQLGQSEMSVLSTSATNPFVRSETLADYRPRPGMPLGVPVSGSMAELLRVPDGAELAIGPVTPSRRRGS